MSDDDAPRPRLCHLKTWPSFRGYGFNLHAEKGKVGQYIGKVDADSPAALAGVRDNDRIVEVNGTNISNENHQQVVQRIKAVPNETKLLVLDAETDKYYQNKRIVVKSDMPNVLRIECPDSQPQEDGGDHLPEIASAPVEPVPNGDAMEDESKFHPRLCILRIRPEFQGYGFNLHAEKSRVGQFIGKVDPDSPAERAGLQENDRIVEVNGVNVREETHAQTVTHIKEDPGVVRMLVIEPDGLADYTQRNVVINGDLPNVEIIDSANFEKKQESTPPPSPKEIHEAQSHVSEESEEKDGEEVEERDELVVALQEENERRESLVAEVVVAAQQEEEEEEEKEPEPEQEEEENEVRPEPELIVEAIAAAVAAEEEEEEEEAHPPLRVCYLKKWADFQGYGFNLHAEKGKSTHNIGSIDSESPAEYAGLRKDDVILEVNGQSIEGENHALVVNKIKEDPAQVRLLVADGDTYDHYASREIHMHSGMTNVDTIEAPALNPNAKPGQVNGSVPEPVVQKVVPEQNHNNTAVHAKEEAPSTVNEVNKGDDTSTGLELGLSAAELRARLSRKKKPDPRHSSMSMKEKYSLFQNL